MKSFSYSDLQNALAKVLDVVCNGGEPVVIQGEGEDAVVLLSLEDYRSLEETAYLLRSPQNARRLFESVASLERR